MAKESKKKQEHKEEEEQVCVYECRDVGFDCELYCTAKTKAEAVNNFAEQLAKEHGHESNYNKAVMRDRIERATKVRQA